MNLKKPKFWDYKKPNIIAYFLLPISLLLQILRLFKKKPKLKLSRIKCICVGNIYLGGTGKTSLSIKIHEILSKKKIKSCFVKKFYSNQTDEQKILQSRGKLFTSNNRIDALKLAESNGYEVAIFDDGLQDKELSYALTIVCFNIQSWIGNGFCLPSGPLRESLNNIKKYDAVFLNGNGEESLEIQNTIKHTSPNIKIFEAQYMPTNIDKLEHNKNYLAFSGIGNPDSFIKTLKKNKFKIVKTLDFPDHYNYSDQDISKIRKTAKDLDAKIITTEKDYNRLNKLNSEGIEYLKIELKILNEEELINFLNKNL